MSQRKTVKEIIAMKVTPEQEELAMEKAHAMMRNKPRGMHPMEIVEQTNFIKDLIIASFSNASQDGLADAMGEKEVAPDDWGYSERKKIYDEARNCILPTK